MVLSECIAVQNECHESDMLDVLININICTLEAWMPSHQISLQIIFRTNSLLDKTNASVLVITAPESDLINKPHNVFMKTSTS